MPPNFGRITFDSPITHKIKTDEIDAEVLFLALENENDAKKLLSLELTGAWINEAKEIPKEILEALVGRLGRYPSEDMGGPSWWGAIMDTNPPDDQSWWYKFAEEKTPDGFEFFTQPSGLSLEAENKDHLPDKYYERMVAVNREEWVNVFVHGNYGFITAGKPVYPMFRDMVHISQDVVPNETLPLFIGVDFGLTPCAIIGQKLVDGRWVLIDELLTDNMGVTRFSELLKSYISTNYTNFKVQHVWGDPAGVSKIDDLTAFEILENVTGWDCSPAETNEISTRLEVVITTLNRMVDGRPGIVASTKCKTWRKGMNGAYHYTLSKSGNGAVTSETPKKDQWSHIQDATQYLLMGGGGVDVMLNRSKTKPMKAIHPPEYNIFD